MWSWLHLKVKLISFSTVWQHCKNKSIKTSPSKHGATFNDLSIICVNAGSAFLVSTPFILFSVSLAPWQKHIRVLSSYAGEKKTVGINVWLWIWGQGQSSRQTSHSECPNQGHDSFTTNYTLWLWIFYIYDARTWPVCATYVMMTRYSHWMNFTFCKQGVQIFTLGINSTTFCSNTSRQAVLMSV